MKAKGFVKQFWLAGIAVVMAAGFGLAGCDQLTNSDDTYSVAIGGFDHGTVTADKASAEKGDLVTLTVTPDPDFRLAANSLTVTTGGTAVTTNPSGNKYTFTMPASNVTVTAVFEALPPQHTITFNTGEGGPVVAAITRDAGTAVDEPQAPARDGYTFLGWFNAAAEGTLHTWPYILNADVTLYAHWQDADKPLPQQYTLTFDSAGGSAVTAIPAYEGTAIAQPADPTKTGYAFSGWFTAAEGGTAVQWPYTLNGSVTLYAHWTGQHTLTFNSGEGGSAVAPVTANEGTALEKPQDPVKDHYDFQGWFTAAEGGTAVQWPYTLNADATLYARWQIRQHTITFNTGEGGPAVAAITANEGTEVAKPTDPTKADHTFLGWFDAAAGGTLHTWPYPLSADVTMYAHWQDAGQSIPQYVLTFDSNGGSPIPASTANAGTAISKPADPTKAGNAFLGWFTAAEGGNPIQWPHTLNANVTVYAHWTAQHTITLNGNGGAPITATITENAGTQIQEPANKIPARDNYKFLGWFTAAEGGNAIVWPHTLNADVTLYAHWTAQHTLTFDTGATGSEVKPITRDAGTSVDQPADPTNTGYDFSGWFTEASGGTAYTWPHALNADVTMYAHWTAQYTITFESNGGTPVTAITKNVGTSVNQPADPTNTGHSFSGWFNAADGGTEYTWPHTLTGDVKMYAHWTAQHTITFESEGGTPVTAITKDVGTSVPQPADPTKAGHSFSGWFDAASGGTAYTWPHTLNADVKMYAQWIVQYTITLNGNGGSPITATITGNAGMKVEEPTNKKPARDNYEFLAWYTEAEGGDAIDWSSYTLTKNVTMYAHWTKQTVALNSVTADGQASPSFEPTTTVTLTFAKDVPGLTADQIEFEADFARVAKGKLVSKGNGVYELPVDALAEEENGGVEFTVTAPDASTKVTLYAWIEVADKDTLASIGTDATTLSRWYKQTKDITIANTWTTIGTSNSNSFTGVYDGGDKEIIPDKITSTANFGIFYYTTGAKLKNIHIGQGEMTTTGTSIGGIVFTAADTEITDCSNAAMLSGKNAGGICGVINNGTIIDRCWNTGTITATNTSATASAGGIHNSKTGSDRTAVIKNCYNTGTITATSSSGNATAGGISGSPTLRLDVIACYNTGTVTANGKTTSYAGGIVGSGNKYEITACANRGTVTSSQILTANTHKVYLGGITGRIGENTVKVTASYNTGAVSWTGSDNNSNGGIGCTGGVIGFITVDAVNLATACYWTTADSSPIHGIGYITTSATDGSNAGTYKFGSAWPSAGSNDGQHAAWGTGKQDGSGEGHYWASLGGSPSNYPRLWFEN